MRITTEISLKKNLRSHTVTGVITAAQFTKYLGEIYSFSYVHTEMDAFWDLINADFSVITTDEVRNFVEYVSNKWGRKRQSRAALVVAGDLDYGMSRI